MVEKIAPAAQKSLLASLAGTKANQIWAKSKRSGVKLGTFSHAHDVAVSRSWGALPDRDAALPSVGRVRRVRTAIEGAARPEGRCASNYDDAFAGVGQSQPTPAHYTTQGSLAPNMRITFVTVSKL